MASKRKYGININIIKTLPFFKLYIKYKHNQNHFIVFCVLGNYAVIVINKAKIVKCKSLGLKRNLEIILILLYKLALNLKMIFKIIKCYALV